jgi:hypothetical protein
METIKQEKVINLNLNLKLGKLKEHNWIRFAVFVFAITPFFFSFGFKRIHFFAEYNELWELIVFSVLMQIPILLIGIPLYILYIKAKYPEKISERRYEFRVSDFQPLHYFFSSFWLSGIFGTISFLICLILNLSQVWFIIILYGYMLLRLLILTPVYLYRNKINNKISAL